MTYKISELLSDVQECAVPLEEKDPVRWEKVEALTFEKIKKAQAGRKAPKARKKRRIAVLAAAALLSVCLTISAAATGALDSVGELFAAWFGGAPDQIELIEQLGQPIGLSDSRNGITISADAILSDGKDFVVLYTASRDDGTALIPADAAPGGALHFGFTGGGDAVDSIRFNFQMNHFTNEAPGDITTQFLCYYEAINEMPDTLRCAFSDLEYWLDDGEGHTQIVKLHERTGDPTANDDVWQFEIPLPTGGQAVETRPIDNEEFSANGEEFAVTGLRVSPLAVTVDYEVTSTTPSAHATNIETRPPAHATDVIWRLPNGEERAISGYSDDDRDFKENMTLLLRKKDGTEIDLSTCVNSMGETESLGTVTPDWEQDKYFCQYGGVLPEVIPLDDMDCVVFNGLEYPIGE